MGVAFSQTLLRNVVIFFLFKAIIQLAHFMVHLLMRGRGGGSNLDLDVLDLKGFVFSYIVTS